MLVRAYLKKKDYRQALIVINMTPIDHDIPSSYEEIDYSQEDHSQATLTKPKCLETSDASNFFNFLPTVPDFQCDDLQDELQRLNTRVQEHNADLI